MGHKRPGPGCVKIHRSYTIAEVAALLDVHRNSVRRWIRQGLAVLDERKPHLILGQVLTTFLTKRNSQHVRLKPGELYCVKCRGARRPALAMADYVPITIASGNLRGLCPECGTLMHRRTGFRNVEANAGNLQVTITERSQRIADRQSLSTNGHIKKEPHPNANALPGK